MHILLLGEGFAIQDRSGQRETQESNFLDEDILFNLKVKKSFRNNCSFIQKLIALAKVINYTSLYAKRSNLKCNEYNS